MKIVNILYICDTSGMLPYFLFCFYTLREKATAITSWPSEIIEMPPKKAVLEIYV